MEPRRQPRAIALTQAYASDDGFVLGLLLAFGLLATLLQILAAS